MPPITKKIPDSVRRQPLYDSRVITTALAQQYDFFKTPVGGTEDSVNKTYFHTNQQVSGQTPNGVPFKVTGISIALWSATAITLADASAILFNAQASFRFEIRRDAILDLPLFELPTNNGMVVTSTTDSDKTYFTNGSMLMSNVFDMGKRSVIISGNAPFNVSVKYDSAPTIVGTVRMFIFLHGSQKSPAGVA